eukprot:9416523-Pyramimonas_sp.AAC.1
MGFIGLPSLEPMLVAMYAHMCVLKTCTRLTDNPWLETTSGSSSLPTQPGRTPKPTCRFLMLSTIAAALTNESGMVFITLSAACLSFSVADDVTVPVFVVVAIAIVATSPSTLTAPSGALDEGNVGDSHVDNDTSSARPAARASSWPPPGCPACRPWRTSG